MTVDFHDVVAEMRAAPGDNTVCMIKLDKTNSSVAWRRNLSVWRPGLNYRPGSCCLSPNKLHQRFASFAPLTIKHCVQPEMAAENGWVIHSRRNDSVHRRKQLPATSQTAVVSWFFTFFFCCCCCSFRWPTLFSWIGYEREVWESFPRIWSHQFFPSCRGVWLSGGNPASLPRKTHRPHGLFLTTAGVKNFPHCLLLCFS